LRVLLIAYEFPPSPSPQSLRWAYLVRELHACGVEVHVLTAESGWPSTWVGLPSGIVIHRTPHWSFPSLVRAVRRRYRHRLRREPMEREQIFVESIGAVAVATAADALAAGDISVESAASKLNWKGRLVEQLAKLENAWTFPDERGQWEPLARKRLRELLRTLAPDVVVSSHEPATTLRLGRIAKEKGFPWVADLGDPVLSFYTPARWRRKSAKLERWTCRHADHLTVTTEAAKLLLVDRHAVREARFSVLTQGYDASVIPGAVPDVKFDAERLELLYTGSFYTFREAHAIVEAVLACPDVRLTIATSRTPEWLPPLQQAHPERLRLLGFLPHAQCLTLQQSADVLVNIANDDPVHVPGKVFEYLGAGRPILHLGNVDEDVAAQLIRTHSRGVVSGNDAVRIGETLAALVAIKRNAAWGRHFDLEHAGVEIYQWQHLGRRLLAILESVRGNGG